MLVQPPRTWCATSDCRLQIVFHGCKRVEPSDVPVNAYGCWDWWGYEGGDCATRTGPQVGAVRAMVADLVGEAPSAR